MVNGYDSISLAASKLNEATSSSMPTAVRDKRFTKRGIGFRTQQEEAASTADYPGGIAKRKRGMSERELPWETAQEATAPQIRPREALEPSGLKENGWMESCFPSEGDARMALSMLSQFVDGPTLAKLQDQIEDQYGDPMAAPTAAPDDEGDWKGADAPLSWTDEVYAYEEAAKGGKGKGGGLDFTAFVFAGGKRYAIDTPANAQKALAQVKKSGEDADVAKVTKAVKKRYPKMEIE